MFDPHSQDTEQYIEELKSGSNNMLVAVRCRPLNSKELPLSDFETVKVLNSKLVVLLDPGNEFEPEDIFRKNRNKQMQYAFDFAFDKFVDNTTVYEDTVSFLIEGVIDGYNATVFAYGATGCGKTYTMVGLPEKPGIMPKCMADLFSKIDNQMITKDIVVKVSYLEIYNENIKDLLISEDRNFDLREDPKLGVVIAGMTEVPVHNIMEINALLKVGNRNRTKEATGANDTSSRSHGILQVTVEAKDKNQGLNTQIKTSKLSLVDLAGSERASSTTNRGIRMVEGAKINQSLLILGNCIQALSQATEKGLKKAFIPYRGSKMTRLLKDSLGGNCRTVMIANVSPAVSSFQDTYNTLMYANRAKSIKTNAQRNVLSVDNHIANYANIISTLRKENQDLKMLLNKNQNDQNKLSLPSIGNSHQPAIIANLETQITMHYQEEMNLMKKAFENDEQVENIGFQIFKLMIRQDKVREASKDGIPSTKESKDGGSAQIKDKIETNKALAQSFFLKKQQCLKQLKEKVQRRDKLMSEVKSSELTQSNQNYMFTLIKQQQIAVQKQQVIYKERKIQNESKQKELLISYLKNQVSLRDKIIEEQKLLIQKNKIISRITYSKLKDLTEISNEAKLAFPQISPNRGQSFKRQPPRKLERARSIDKIDYDFVQSPRRRASGHGNSLSNKKAYYNHEVEHEMKKKQLKSDASVDSLSEKHMSKRKKKVSYLYPEKLRDDSLSEKKEPEKAERLDRGRNFDRVRSKDRLDRSPEGSLPNPLFLKKKPKYQASPNPQKHDNLNVYMIQR